MWYISSTLEWRHIGWVGDKAVDVYPHLFADSDFAGCAQSSKSTSGSFLCFRGPATFFPVAMQSSRLGCASHSIPEAEIVAADFAMRMMGLPVLDLVEIVLRPDPLLYFHQDNPAMIAVCRTGRNPTMRHLHRTHRVSVDWLHEGFARDDVVLLYETPERHCADIFTKAFVNPEKWRHVCELIVVLTKQHTDRIVEGSGQIPGTFVIPPQVAIPEQQDETYTYSVAMCVPAFGHTSEGASRADHPEKLVPNLQPDSVIACRSRGPGRGSMVAGEKDLTGESLGGTGVFATAEFDDVLYLLTMNRKADTALAGAGG